jgi:hypothetical protein
VPIAVPEEDRDLGREDRDGHVSDEKERRDPGQQPRERPNLPHSRLPRSVRIAAGEAVSSERLDELRSRHAHLTCNSFAHQNRIKGVVPIAPSRDRCGERCNRARRRLVPAARALLEARERVTGRAVRSRDPSWRDRSARASCKASCDRSQESSRPARGCRRRIRGPGARNGAPPVPSTGAQLDHRSR